MSDKRNMNRCYNGNLQERLRSLSTRTNCPTRQENGQRYLGPPVDWYGKAPTSSEVFISKLPASCFEDEIYDFCSQVGKIYLLRLMINFENENRGFCFVTYSSPREAAAAVSILPQKQLRKGLHVHAEISLNNCTLKMYGLDFRWKDELLEQEIRANTKDMINVTIRRNMSQRTLVATLYFDTHQKAAIARRRLSQIANSRWGQNVKVFLWSKKLQNKINNKQEPETINPTCRSTKRQSDVHCNFHWYQNQDLNTCNKYGQTRDFPNNGSQWIQPTNNLKESDSPTSSTRNSHTMDDIFSYDNFQYDLNNNVSPKYETSSTCDPFTFPSLASISDSSLASPSSDKQANTSLSSCNSPTYLKSPMSDVDPFMNWNTDMFPKPSTLILDLHSPFEYYSEKYVSSYDTRHTNRHIEVILQEALEALNCGE